MINWLNQTRIAYAHCDVPCGIYDPASAQIAAHSVARFLNQIAEIEADVAQSSLPALAKLSRLVEQKETHAAQVKSDINVIWGDYFKDQHLEKFPQIHSLTHQIMQKASACKQETVATNGAELVDLVNQFAEIFWETKDIKTQIVTAPYLPNLPIVRPVLDDA